MNSNETQAANAQKHGCRGCLIAIAIAVFCVLCLFSLGLNCLYPSTYTVQRRVHTYDGEPMSVSYLRREYVVWGVHPDLFMFDIYPGYTRVEVTVKGKTYRHGIRDFLYLFGVHVYDERCFLILWDLGKWFHLYSAPLAGGEFSEVPLNTLPAMIAYANFGGVYEGVDKAEERTLPDEFMNSEEFYETRTVDLWHQVATGRRWYYPMDKAAFERFKQQFQAARKEYQAKQNRKPLP